ncbi:hypothetical protein ScPMuIL_010051 [Solemya velum]
MGNTEVVADGVKAQGDSESCELYKLVDLKGGGQLIDMMKKARWTKNYQDVDEKIKNELIQYLYNGGKGKMIPISDLVMKRNNGNGNLKTAKMKKCTLDGKSGLQVKHSDEEANINNIEPKSRLLCWDIDKLGAVGETILHLCFLNATTVHADLAKRLLQHFPLLIKDIYLADEYYGENVLHMAIVNEEPAVVKFLLDKGADYHGRCCGIFYCPTDQKKSRRDNLDHESVEVCLETNYQGQLYWGEYPLSFAANLEQEECVRLLVAKGANPNLQDNNGNTVLHLCVINNKSEMFDLLHSLGANLDIKNRQGLTPLTLAAKLAKTEMYNHILTMIQHVYWVYGNVTCAGFPVHDIDTISPTGEINRNSVLSLIVYGEDRAHLEMMDGLMVNLLDEKWKTFVRHRFYRRFLIFCVYFLIVFCAFLLRPQTDMCPTLTTVVNATSGGVTNVTDVDKCYLLKACRLEDKVRFSFEILSLLGAMMYIFLAMKEIWYEGIIVFFLTLKCAPSKALFLLSCLFMAAMLPGRATCAYVYEDVMAVLTILFTAPYFLFFCRGFKMVGPFVVMIYQMIRGDLLRFFIIYSVFIIGFSQAMYIVFRVVHDDVFSYPLEAIMGVFMMSLGEFGDFYESFDKTQHPTITIIVFVLYMILVTLLLVNMLIAMMGNTYQLVNETQKEWLRQWAKIILVVEQTVTKSERRKAYKTYTQPMDGGFALSIRWHQSEKEKEEIKRIEEFKKLQALNMKAQKKKKRPGSGTTAGKSSGASSAAASEQDLNVNVLNVKSETEEKTRNGTKPGLNSVTAIKVQTIA